MTCHLLCAKPLPKLLLTPYQLGTSVKLRTNCNSFHSRKFISKLCLQSDAHFVQVLYESTWNFQSAHVTTANNAVAMGNVQSVSLKTWNQMMMEIASSSVDQKCPTAWNVTCWEIAQIAKMAFTRTQRRDAKVNIDHVFIMCVAFLVVGTFLWSSKSFTLSQPANHLFIKINLLRNICTKFSHACCSLCR